MTRDELLARLSSKGVHESLYSLDGLSKQSESYSVIHDGEGWKVIYKERGQISEIASGLKQNEAYDCLYNEFQKIYGWKD